MDDIAYKMGFDIYNCPLEDTLNIKVDRLYFNSKMKMLNEKFDSDFLQSLFYSITQGKSETTINYIFELFNVLKDDSYKDLFYKKDIFAVYINISMVKIISIIKISFRMYIKIPAKMFGKNAWMNL